MHFSCVFMSIPSKSINLDVSIIYSIFFLFVLFILQLLTCLCKSMMLVRCSAFASSIFVDLNIDLIIGFGMLLFGNKFKPCILIVVHLYFVWLYFNHVSHMVITNFLTYKNLQLLTISIRGCVLPTKWTVIKSNKHSNDNGNSFSISIACSWSCAKLTILPLNACWPLITPLLVYFNLNNIVRQWYLAIKISSTIVNCGSVIGAIPIHSQCKFWHFVFL